MRRLIAITAFALSLAVPLWAQHAGHGGGFGGLAGGFGGGHVGGFAGHGGFSGGHISSGGGHFSGGIHSGPVARGFSHAPLGPQRSFSRGPFLHDGFPQAHFRGPIGFRGDRFRNGCYGYGCWSGYGYGYPWYPWWYAGYYDPWWWWDADAGYDSSYEQDQAYANAMNEQNLEEQRMLRQEERDGDQDAYARSAPAAAHTQPEGAPVLPATVLVFRDQHRREIQNYAIVGQSLWTFSPQRTEKIPLADLDLAATASVNDERGLTFRLPVGSRTQ